MAVKLTVSPIQDVLAPVKLAVGSGSTAIVIILLVSLQVSPLNVATATRWKSVVVAKPVVGV